MAWYDDWIKNALKESINETLKADGDSFQKSEAEEMGDSLHTPKLPDVPEPKDKYDPKEQIGRQAIIDDPYFDHVTQHVLYKHKLSRVSNKTLKDVSMRDWVVSAIIQVRVDTLLRFSRPASLKTEMGYRFIKRNKHEDYSDSDKAEIAALESFIYNCGRTENTPPNDKLLFGEFMKLTARDCLTFGNLAIEKIKTRAGGLHRFRPLPTENIYLINKKISRQFVAREIEAAKAIYKPGDNDPRSKQTINEVDVEYYKYVQMSFDNRTLNAFGDEDMIWKLFNPQNFADSMGYCYSPLEQCILNITHHLNVENYNANFFTHGYAARGVLHLKGTVTQSQLQAFRRQFYNTITGAQHAWRTPVIAGLEDVQWVPMSGSAREMEYINFNNHLLRAICAQFQIDPIEIGMEYLNTQTGRGANQQANNEYKIEYSRERGLYPLLMFFEDMINTDIVPALDQVLADKYKFVFTGYTDESPQTIVAQQQAEMTVHASMNDLLVSSEKKKIDSLAADLPLNQAFWALVEKNFTKGEIREKFFGDKDATKRRELQYIPGDPAFMGWQQLLLTIDRAKKQDEQMEQQAQAQAQQQQLEGKHAEGEHNREQEKHDYEMEAAKSGAAHAAVAHGNDIKDIGKQFGAASKPLEIGGQPVANPLNKSEDEH